MVGEIEFRVLVCVELSTSRKVILSTPSLGSLNKLGVTEDTALDSIIKACSRVANPEGSKIFPPIPLMILFAFAI